MGLILFSVALLLWASIVFYQENAVSGFLLILLSPLIAVCMFLLVFLVWVATLGSKMIYFEID
jgi:hypothetical protein